MSVNDDLGTRMKSYYENIPKIKLMRRTPVVIHIDGKAFHTFTKGFDRPFDKVLMTTMQETTQYLCENIQGCVFGYTQSDEITLILIDYKRLNSSAWFDYEVQKLCSISANMATMAFNKSFAKNAEEFMTDCAANYEIEGLCGKGTEEYKLCEVYQKAMNKGAMFDARCFNIPKEEVTNLIYWRQLDATRNSIQMVGQANFTHKELQNKNCNDIQNMLLTEKGINWNNYPINCKRGTAVIKEDGCWIIDDSMPILKGENRQYVDRFVFCWRGIEND